MKLTVITILTIGLLSCNNFRDKNSVDNKTELDSSVQVDSIYINENETEGSTSYMEYYSCDFDKFLYSPKTPKLAKDIFFDSDWNLSNDNEALALLDSLTAKDKTSRAFYFKVVTKTEKRSDGYFSEGLGYVGYNYVLHNTQEFASYFDNKQCHTANDLVTWANIVIMEFSIREEGNYDKAIADDYIMKLKSNCKNCSTTQKETINKFGVSLKDKWSEFLNHTD